MKTKTSVGSDSLILLRSSIGDDNFSSTIPSTNGEQEKTSPMKIFYVVESGGEVAKKGIPHRILPSIEALALALTANLRKKSTTSTR